ncbi:TetR/AcrR family transcriptional regulator [soil metagenome]
MAGSYHHGNLQRALKDETLRMLATLEHDAISLREVARNVGVDHRAAYRHFADRETLLGEVAEDGYRALIVQLEAQLAKAPASSIGRLLQFARSYVEFSLAEPGYYRAMIRPRVVDKQDRPADAGDAALAILEREVRAGIASHQLVAENVTEMAVGLWASMHGLASLIATRRLYVTPRIAVAYTNRIFERSLRGLVCPAR